MSAGNEREFIDYVEKREGGKAMKCPLLYIAACSRGGVLDESISNCLKEECVSWNEAYSCCDFKEGVRALGEIEFYLKAILEKMPHAGQFLQKP